MNDNQTFKTIKDDAKWLYWMGIFMVVIGLLAIIFPVVSTLAVNYFVGGVLMFAGFFQLIGSFSVRGTGPFFGALLLAVLTLAAGTFMVFNPLAGAMALTLILAILFIVEGTFHTILAFELKPNPGWSWVLTSGVISIVLGLFVASGLAKFSLFIIGILLGINFLSTGFAFFAFLSPNSKNAITLCDENA